VRRSPARCGPWTYFLFLGFPLGLLALAAALPALAAAHLEVCSTDVRRWGETWFVDLDDDAGTCRAAESPGARLDEGLDTVEVECGTHVVPVTVWSPPGASGATPCVFVTPHTHGTPLEVAPDAVLAALVRHQVRVVFCHLSGTRAQGRDSWDRGWDIDTVARELAACVRHTVDVGLCDPLAWALVSGGTFAPAAFAACSAALVPTAVVLHQPVTDLVEALDPRRDPTWCPGELVGHLTPSAAARRSPYEHPALSYHLLVTCAEPSDAHCAPRHQAVKLVARLAERWDGEHTIKVQHHKVC